MNIRLIRGWEKVKDKGRGEEEIVVEWTMKGMSRIIYANFKYTAI